MLKSPLESYRETLGLTPSELAAEVGVSVVIILLQERGIPHHLHPKFIRKFPDSIELIPSYQAYRKACRRRNFVHAHMDTPPESGPAFAEWLRKESLTPEHFSELACMPMPDIQYALHHWRMPSTLNYFFEEINE